VPLTTPKKTQETIRSRRKRIGCAVLIALFLALCLGSVSVTIMADQPTLMVMAYLQGAELSGVTTTREQTLSGQWVTMVRFSWRKAGSTATWTPGALRVKTDHWWFFTYIRAVEDVEP